MRIRSPREPKHRKTKAWLELHKLLTTKTQQEIADDADVAQSVVNSLLNLQSRPNVSTLFKLEKTWGIKAAWWDQPLKTGRAA